KQLTFRKPDMKKFPALALSFHVAKKGGTLPAVLNAADEEAVDAFLAGKVRFTSIYKMVERVVMRHQIKRNPDLGTILDADQWAREETQSLINGSHGTYTR